MLASEALSLVRKCEKNWERPKDMSVEFFVDFFFNGISVKTTYGNFNRNVVIPFKDIEEFGEIAVANYLSSITRDLRDDRVDAFRYGIFSSPVNKRKIPNIKRVIFNDPATIVFWNDNTKTIVKTNGEKFDPEKGLAMAISKKAMGNLGNYYDEFKKHLGDLQ